MKKNLLFTFFIIVLSLFAFQATASAEQVTTFPVTLVEQTGTYYVSTAQETINNFTITNVAPYSDNYNKIDYVYEYTRVSGSPTLVMHCYDEGGYLLETISFSKYSKSTYVPRYTATVEIAPKYPAAYTQSYLYRNPVALYAPDERVLYTTDLMVPVYESLGWSKPVTMYAPVNGEFSRTMEIHPSLVPAYEAVGWYTYGGAIFYQIQKNCNYYMAIGDYESVFVDVETFLPIFIGSKYEAELYTIRTNAMNTWRNYCGKPIGFVKYEIGANSIGTPQVTLHFRNLSYKAIASYKAKFDCYDAAGNQVNNNRTVYSMSNSDMDIADSELAIATIYGAKNGIATVKNIRITEITFEDGTKWYGE